MIDRIRLPTPREAPEKPTFPLLASAAPVVGALALWALTQSPLALVFAFLGPLVAIGGLIDSRRRHRKRTRIEARRFSVALADITEQIDAAHEAERRSLARVLAPAFDLLRYGRPTRERWRYQAGDPLLIALGIGTTASELTLDGSGGGDAADLAQRAAVLTDAPILCDARDGIGVTGTPAPALALLRAVVLQLAHRVGPHDATLTLAGVVDVAEEWLHDVPHYAAAAENAPALSGQQELQNTITIRFRSSDGKTLALVALAPEPSRLPRECRTVVRVGGATADILHSTEASPRATEIRPHLITREHARGLARNLRRAGEDDGLPRREKLPGHVSFTQLGAQPPAGASSLACAFAVGTSGAPVTIDLVGDGPHALVGGTTGSGKSELLCAWVLAMAATRTPTQLNVLLIDFKGGASFRIIESLPHCVGTVTDLDPAEAERALTSLRAELLHRERVLAQHSVRDVTELHADVLPRLVIVVDEYAALVTEHPSLHAVFADIAARGRSLGVHLILSTQRPAGVVRDAVLANAAIRVSLRVLEASDSVAVIGVPDAAALDPDKPGRALVSVVGRAVTPVQPALVTAQDVAAVHSSTAPAPDQPAHPLRRPWLPPLPLSLTPQDLAGSEGDSTGIRFALADRTTEQRQVAVSYDPSVHGHLLIVGARGSGRSSALAALAAVAGTAAAAFPSDLEGAWDAVHAALDAARGGDATVATPRLYLLDDLDTVVSRLPDDYRDAFVRALCALLQEGPASGIHCAVSVARIGSTTSAVAALCESRLVLRMSDRHDHQLAGADPSRFTPHLPPGRGWWRGDLVQVAHVERSLEPSAPPTSAPPVPLERRSMLVVSTRPVQLRDALAAAWGSGAAELVDARDPNPLTVSEPGEPSRILIADPELWQSRWSQFAELGRHVPVVFHECGLSLFRQFSGSRALPPPLARPGDSVWLAHPGASVLRAVIPRP